MSAPLSAPLLNPSQVARDFILEINLAGTYTPFSLKNIDPTTDDGNMEGENRYSDAGYSRSNKTGTGWNVTATVPVATLQASPTTYDPALLYIMQTVEGALGLNAQCDIRFYEYSPSVNSPRIYARQGLALCTFKGNFGDPTANRDATLTFTGQGQLNKITHPYPQTPLAPTITSLTPSTLAASGSAGKQVIIAGTGFTTTVAGGVKFNGVAATSYIVESDTRIVASLPTLTAGAVPVTVQNAAGTSTAVNLTAT